MNKEVLLVLGIIEGRGWHPVEGHKTVIEAHLDNHKLSTGTFPSTNTPKFNTEITWEAEKKTIRSYKLNRVPIKIECYSLDSKERRKSLGYIVLPLASAVEQVQVDSKWYKLLGGSNTKYKAAPSLLLRLHLETLNSDKQKQIPSNKQMTAFRNGQHANDDVKMSYMLEKANKFIQGRDELEIRPAHTNGNTPRSVCEQVKQPTHPSMHVEGTNGVYGNNVQMGDDEMESDNMEDEDMLDYDSEEDYSDENQDDTSGMIIDAYSLADQKQRSGEGVENVNSGHAEAKENKLKTSDVTVPVPTTSSKSLDRDSEPESLLKTRNNAREFLRSVSQDLLVSKLQNGSSNPSPNTSLVHLNSLLAKRVLDTSNFLSDDKFDLNTKARKVDDNSSTLAEESFSDQVRESTEKAKQETDWSNSVLKSKLSLNKDTTTAAFLLSQSIGRSTRPKTNTVSSPHQSTTKLVAHLNQEQGYFTIGPQIQAEEFIFSITVIYAKNLAKLIPERVLPCLEGDFRFCYSLLGHSIYTEPFTNLKNPEFLAEKAAATIRSSHESLSNYFNQHYFLPVHFVSGETCLGVCTIDSLQLVEIANKNESSVEGVFEINPVEDQNMSHNSDSKAILAISLQVSKTNNSKVVAPRASCSSYNEIVVSDSMSSGSDCEDLSFVKRKMKMSRERFCTNCRNNFSGQEERFQRQTAKAERDIERQKNALLHEAAYEVERWKEEQKKYYLKEWSEKEETLQRMIASEWSSKVKIMEGELSHRLGECDKLQEKLNTALAELSVREEKIKFREKKVMSVEKELNIEKEKLLSSGKLKPSQQERGPSNQHLTRQFEIEKKKRMQLENEASSLQAELVNSEEHLKCQTEEIISLRRKLIQSDDIIGVAKDKDIMMAKIESLQERKQYYKAQWLSAITDLHKLHSAHKNTIEQITCDTTKSPPQECSSSSLSPSGYKLRKLRDERKILLESGIYPLNHSIIKRIDKKIKDLVG